MNISQPGTNTLKKDYRYHDLWFRLVVALFAAHFVVVFGEKESTFQLMLTWDYYRSVLFSFVIAFLLVSLAYLVTCRLDRYYDWKQLTIQRIGLQLLLGLILPAVTAFLLAFLYFRLYHIRILDTDYVQYVFPVVILMLLMLNMYYLAFYFYRQWQITAIQTLNENVPVNTRDKQRSIEIFIVSKGTKNIPLPVKTISYFYHDGEYNFLRTFEGEDFIISQALDEVEKLLPKKEFFRANRQLIVSLMACRHFESLDYGKLELFTEPPLKQTVVISRRRAKPFKEWIRR